MKNNNKSLMPFSAYLMLYVILMPILMFLYHSYNKLQQSIFSNDNTMLFIHDSISIFIMILSPGIIILCIELSRESTTSIKIMKIKLFSFIAFMVFFISIFILVYEFLRYTDVNKNGINVRSGIFLTEKNYTWNNVTYADVSCKHTGKSNTKIVYNIYLNDGTVVEVNNSNDFFNKIIELDDFMKNKKIKIIRGTLEAKDYSNFESSLKSSDKEVSHNAEVVLQILNK